jgi:hypothetical protein
MVFLISARLTFAETLDTPSSALYSALICDGHSVYLLHVSY